MLQARQKQRLGLAAGRGHQAWLSSHCIPASSCMRKVLGLRHLAAATSAVVLGMQTRR